MEKRTAKSALAAGMLCAAMFAAVSFQVLFNMHVTWRLPFAAQLVLLVVTCWLVLIPTVLFMRRDKTTARDIGFAKDKVPQQVLVGAGLGIATSGAVIFVPHLIGFSGFFFDYSAEGMQPWHAAFGFARHMLGVAVAEEIAFRGYLFKKLLDVKNSRRFATAVSSAVFGLFHVFHFSLQQIIFATLLGIMWCVFRLKIRHCSLLALIFAHGIHNSLLPVFVAVLRRMV